MILNNYIFKLIILSALVFHSCDIESNQKQREATISDSIKLRNKNLQLEAMALKKMEEQEKMGELRDTTAKTEVKITRYPNGNIQSKLMFENGRPSGIAQMYDSAGRIKESGYWVNGQWIGNYLLYHPNGRVKSRWTYGSNGKRIGLSISYHPNGIISDIGYYVDGKEEGLAFGFDSLGKHPNSVLIYENGEHKPNIEKSKIAPYEDMLLDYVRTENENVFRVQNLQKSQLENKMNTEKLAYEQKVRYYFIGGSVLLFGLLILFINRFRITRKQKRIIEEQKHFVDEKQKEIIDSIRYAKRIQQALLPSSRIIDRDLTKLNKN